MDYSGIYIELMERAKNRTLDGYSESHHVIPRCMDGDDHPRNLVKLTPEEHFLSHQILVKIYPDNRGLIHAANMMCTASSVQVRNNKMFGWLKRRFSESNTGENNPMWGKRGCDSTLSKPINQYTKDGVFVRTWDSISDAATAIGVNPSGISMCCHGKRKAISGFIFKYVGDDSEVNYINNGIKPINQYTKDGVFIRSWYSILDASKEFGIDSPSISKCCRGKLKSVGGFIWKYVNDNTSAIYVETKMKSVNQYTKSGEFVKHWVCIADVERNLKIDHGSISACCLGKLKSAGGFIWKYTNQI